MTHERINPDIFKPLMVAYESLQSTICVFKDQKPAVGDITKDICEYISNPLEFGEVWNIEKSSDKMRMDIIQMITETIMYQDRFKNRIIHRDEFVESYSRLDGINPGEIIDKFYEKFDSDNLAEIVYEQILDSAKRTLPYKGPVSRYGKDQRGIILNYLEGTYHSYNGDWLKELKKLIRIEFEDADPLTVDGEGDLPCTVTTFKNNKLKLLFDKVDQADHLIEILTEEGHELS